MPWDWSYYSEKLKDIRFNVNDEMTRPYFELNHVKKGVFGPATQLYGITFKENKEIPVYHPEVEAYEVYDADGKFLSILYTDFHPRDGKQSGAWMNSIKEQYRDQDGKDSRPQIIIVMNFTRPTETKPSLLTFDEVNTLLHEFGHALHGMFAEGSYASLSGTNVYRDFVELPSQLMENWLTEKEFSDQIAIHYKTREKNPARISTEINRRFQFQRRICLLPSTELRFLRYGLAYPNRTIRRRCYLFREGSLETDRDRPRSSRNLDEQQFRTHLLRWIFSRLLRL